MTTTPTPGDLSARLHSANTLFERMLRECARPVTGSPEGVPWLAAEAYREVAIAALSAPPAGGEPVEDLANRVEGIAAWMGHRFGTGCVEADHASLLWQIAKDMRRSLTTPPPDAAVLEWDGSTRTMREHLYLMTGERDRYRKLDEQAASTIARMGRRISEMAAAVCGTCGDTIKPDVLTGTTCQCAAVGAQGEASKIADEIMRLVQHGPTVDWRPNMAEIAEKVRRLATPAAGKGVDDASERQPDGYAYRYEDGFIRHNGGRDHNGMRPTETIPFYYGSAPALTRQPVAGDGMVLVPRELTAENGAKAALSGEFCEHVEIRCAECDDGMLDDDTPCDDCDGRGSHRVKVPVEWDTVKSIHKAMVAHFAAPAATPTDGGEGS